MTRTLELTRIGDATGIILPRDILEKLRVHPGDVVRVVETAAGIELTAHDPELAGQMAVAERVMDDDREVLRKLAE